MTNNKALSLTAQKFGYCGLLLSLLLAVAAPVSSQDDKGVESIDAIARGTSTQSGKDANIKIIIYNYSTPEDRQVLVDAFQKGQNDGLVKALTELKSVGRIAISGTVGTDLGFVAVIPTATGRKIRFAANRPIGVHEAYNSGRSTSYNLIAGEIDLNNSDKDKSSGVLYPAAQLLINKEGQLELELRQNPWKLVNIIDWNKAGSKE